MVNPPIEPKQAGEPATVQAASMGGLRSVGGAQSAGAAVAKLSFANTITRVSA
jgi:hypothetical protein